MARSPLLSRLLGVVVRQGAAGVRRYLDRQGPSSEGAPSQAPRPRRTTRGRATRPLPGPAAPPLRGTAATAPQVRATPAPRGAAPRSGGDRYAGDHTGPVRVVYAPDPDGAPDPGEVVWTWVPYEEDHSRGKDRPVLLVGHDGPWLLGLMLSTRDHDTGPARAGERWLDLGPGGWDPQRRPSEVRLDRVLRLSPDAVRREGAVLDRARFEEVARALR